MKRFILVGFILLVAIVAAGCSSGYTSKGKGGTPPTSAPTTSSAKGPTNGLVQTSDAGNVTIDVKWGKAEGTSLVFSVVMDTHSVDLDQYDLKRLAVLRDDAGKEYRPVSWNAPAGGHHRAGALSFPLPDSVSQGQAKYVEMVITNIAGVKERVLKWQL